jgi:16S rRNA processing protein RimM
LTSQRRQHANRLRNKETGSLKDGELLFILVGVLRRPHGLKGEALVSLQTDFPDRLQKGLRLYLGEDHKPVTIRSRRQHNDGLLMAFDEMPDKTSLEDLHNAPLFVHINETQPLPDGEYYQHQLLGLDVVTEEGQLLGKVTEILDTTANAVYVVRHEKSKEILLPSIKDVVRAIDLENKRITVRLMPGMVEDDPNK